MSQTNFDKLVQFVFNPPSTNTTDLTTLASFCRYAGEEHNWEKKAHSALNLAESKDVEIARLKEEVKTLQATLKADQEILVEV